MRVQRAPLLGVCLALVAGTLAAPGVAGAAPDTQTRPAAARGVAAGPRAALTSPEAALGPGWRTSSDVLVTGVGDTDGFHLYVAREKTAFAWSTLATLNASLPDAGTWVGNVCVTGSGRYAAVMYAPGRAVNRPKLMRAGGFAAVVDTATGRAHRIPAKVQLAYFNPACGAGDRVLFTRAVGDEMQQTDLIAVDAATGRITGTRRVHAQLTTPVPAAGADYGVAHGALVKVAPSGALTPVTSLAGPALSLRPTADGAIDLLTVERDRTVAHRYAAGRLTRLGDAPRGNLQLFGQAGGGNVLVGDVRGIAIAGQARLSAVRSDRRVQAVSQQGHLLVLSALSQQVVNSVKAHGAPAQAGDAGRIRVTVKAVRGGQVSSGTVATEHLPVADSPTGAGRAAPPAMARTATPAAARAATISSTVQAGDPPWNELPPDPGPAPCAVPRNRLDRQALQPSPNMVEWAVDLAVHGRLTVQRRRDHFKTGLNAYTPQGLLPLEPGPTVPAQVMLGILAQESNLAQATWHAVPGDAGNPLISSYYGSRDDVDVIDYTQADCGYGIAQVTDGMRVNQVTYTPMQQAAIVTDYAANIAAGLNILIKKWKELQAVQTSVNNGDPTFIENWYLAVWGYNTGVYPNPPPHGTKGYGVGWLNNPGNPIYPADRGPFLRNDLGDAAQPWKWAYQEKVMGWAETPQWVWEDDGSRTSKYVGPSYPPGGGGPYHLMLPDRLAFCGNGNACDPAHPADPCPNTDSSCWWHGNATWVSCVVDQSCATEAVRFHAGDAEPPIQARYQRSCAPFRATVGTLAFVVDDIADPSRNLLGCAGQQPWGGKFTLRLGDPSGSVASEYAGVDLHSFGAGHNGHIWFTHSYPSHNFNANQKHRVVGTWTPDIATTGNFEIVAHLPSHGADVRYAEYSIRPNLGDPAHQDRLCFVDQKTNGVDKWVSLGWYRLGPGARVQLSNIMDPDPGGNPPHDGTVDIAFDAMAFVSVASQPAGHICNSDYARG